MLYPGVYVGEGARVGADCVLYPNVTVRERCVVGERGASSILSAVIGSDGFGFACSISRRRPRHVKIPQAGIVRIEDDVEVGACTCIDRATLGETVIGRGTKIDNLVQIAHNVQVGPLSLLVAQCGVSGSTTLGAGVILAGQVGVVGHIKIGDMAPGGRSIGRRAGRATGRATVSGIAGHSITASGSARPLRRSRSLRHCLVREARDSARSKTRAGRAFEKGHAAR